jgi:hypothetical protein
MLLHSVAMRPALNEESSVTGDSTQLNALLLALEAGKRFLDTLLSFPMDEYYLLSFAEWMRLPTVIMTVARLSMPTNAHASSGWDYKTAQERVRLDLCLEALCYRMQQLSTYDKAKQSHPDFWYAMRFINDLTKSWYMRKIKPPASAQPTPGGLTTHSDGEPTPASDQPPSFGLGTGMDMGATDDGDPFAFMKDLEFDMDQVFDMGIWGDESYTGMGCGGGMAF